MTRRRAAALALACAAALTLGGCAVEGTVTIESAQRVAVDVTVRNPDTASCDGYAEAVGWGLVVTPVEGDTGPRCRFVGSVDPAKLGLANVLLIDGGEHLFFGLYPIGPGATLGSRSMHSVLDLDLRFVFPGPVLRSSGTMSGNEAGFTREQLLEGGLTAVGQGHPGPCVGVVGPRRGPGGGHRDRRRDRAGGVAARSRHDGRGAGGGRRRRPGRPLGSVRRRPRGAPGGG